MAQVYAYWFLYDDSRGLKGLVLTLWYVCSNVVYIIRGSTAGSVLESVHTALSIHAIYQYYVLDIGDPLNIAYIVWFVCVCVSPLLRET